MIDDDDIDERELREAEALARALERGSAMDELPDDALEAAALIRYSRDGGALAKEREDRLLEDVLAAAERVGGRERERAPVWRWVFGVLGFAAVTALFFLIVRAPDAPAPTALPAPSPRLLELELARLEDDEAEPRFDAEMRAYRGEVYAALGARYGAR